MGVKLKNHIKTIFVFAFLFITSFAFAGTNLSNDKISDFRYRVTAIEVESKNPVSDFDKLITDTEKLIEEYPDRAEPYIWNGIALSAQAKHKGIKALSNVKKARNLLEKAISIDSSASDGAAYNALGMLYYKVPAWPVAFGDNDRAEDYFKKALLVSSNLDTNYRYGEFLIEEKNDNKNGLQYLEKALSFNNRPGRPEDVLKKSEIKKLISKIKEVK